MEWILGFFGYCHASVVERERGWLKEALDALTLANKRESRTSNELAAVDEYLSMIHATRIPGTDVPESTLDAAKAIGNLVSIQAFEIASLRSTCAKISEMAGGANSLSKEIGNIYPDASKTN